MPTQQRQRLPNSLCLIHPLQGWRRQAAQPIKRALLQPGAESGSFLVSTLSAEFSLLERSGWTRIQSDEEMSAEGENAPPLLYRIIWRRGDRCWSVSTYGRVDYDLNTDIKGFDWHFVESEPWQRHRGSTVDMLIATWDVKDQSVAKSGLQQ